MTKVVRTEDARCGTVHVGLDSDGDVEIFAESGPPVYIHPAHLIDALKTLGVLPRDTRPAPAVRSASDRVRASWLRHARPDADERTAIRDHVMRREVERCRRAEEARARVWDGFKFPQRVVTGMRRPPLSLLTDRQGDTWEVLDGDHLRWCLTSTGVRPGRKLIAPRAYVEAAYGPLRTSVGGSRVV